MDAQNKKPLARGRVTKLMGQFEQADPEIKRRAEDEVFFRENILHTQQAMLDDTLGRVFTASKQDK